MGSESFAGFFDGFDKGVAELFVFEMRAHRLDQALPKLLAAFFVNGFVADHSKLVDTGRHENEHCVLFYGLVHSEPMKFLLRRNQRIDGQFAALNKDSDLPGRFRLGIFGGIYNGIVLELAQEFFGSHLLLPTSARTAAAKTSAAPADPTESPPPPRRPPAAAATDREKYGAAAA